MIKLKEKKIGIFILAYKRLEHLKRVISPLVKYTHPKDIIYIFADNYKKKNFEVIKVHNYLKKLNKKKFKVIFQKKNLGLKENWWRAYDFMYAKYDKVICLEDDIVIKKEFLNFMMENLVKFENDKRIMNITGYAFPIKLSKNYNYNLYFTERPCAWGQGSWSRVWKLFKKNKEKQLDILLNKKKLNILKKGGDDIVHMFVHDYLGYINSIQIWSVWNILKNKGVCINPINSMVKNIGFDGTGTHYNESTEKSETIIINKRKLKKLNLLLYDEKISKSFNNYFKISYKLKIIYTIFPIHLIIYGYKVLDFCSNFFKKLK